jgi:MFS family permease
MISNWASNTFRALGHPGYRVLWTGSTLAFLAFAMMSVVQSVVAFDLTGKNGSVGAVALGMGIAQLTIAPFGGVLADRLPKRRLVLIGQSILGMTFLSVAILITTGHITILWLASSTFIMGAVFSFIGPARTAWIGEILPGPRMANGIALQQLAMTSTRIFGPFVAGAAISIAFLGTAGAYYIMAGLFVFVVGSVWFVPGGRVARAASGKSILGDMKLGVMHMRDRPRLMLLALGFIGFIMAGFSYQTILPGYLENALGESPKKVALLYGLSAIAGLAATIILAGMTDRTRAFKLMMLAGLLMAVALACMAAAPTLLIAVGAMVLVGIATSSYQLLNNSLVMQEADPVYHGRVMSLTMMAWGVNGVVAFPFGMLADRVGERETLAIMGMLVLIVSAITFGCYTMLTRRERGLDALGAPVESAPGIGAKNPLLEQLP